MPVIDDACPYTISNGKIARYDIKDGKCRVYASFSLNEFESKEIKILLVRLNNSSRLSRNYLGKKYDQDY